MIAQINTSSNDLSQTAYPTRLTRLEYNLLRITYDDHLVQGFTKRDCNELGKRFNRHPKTIAKALRDLVSYGFLTSKKGGKGHANILCITFVGFSFLEGQPLPQTLPHNSTTPNIDLSKKDETDLILKAEEICVQLSEPEPEPEIDIFKKLDNFFVETNVPYSDREEIKTKLNRTRIGPVRTERLIERITNPKQKNAIRYPRSFFAKCIENEERELAELFKIFRGKNLQVNLYATQ
jgi:hypothetical protein